MALILREHCVMEKVCLMEVYIYIYMPPLNRLYIFFKQSTKHKLGQALVSFLPGVRI